MAATNGRHPQSFEVRVLRQDGPEGSSRWERHRVTYEPGMNVISVLQQIAANAVTADGKRVAPVAWEANCLEEVCGACTMVINGQVRQACSALVDRLLADRPGEIEIRPMSKFPVLRDLVVDRSRLFYALRRSKAWVAVDDYYDRGPGPRQTQAEQERAYPATECMSCGCCLEACPQYLKIDAIAEPGESGEHFRHRAEPLYEDGFIGAHAINQIVLFNHHPTGRANKAERMATSDRRGRNSGLRKCPELRRRLPEGDSSHHLDRPRRSRRHDPRLQEVLRSLKRL